MNRRVFGSQSALLVLALMGWIGYATVRGLGQDAGRSIPERMADMEAELQSLEKRIRSGEPRTPAEPRATGGDVVTARQFHVVDRDGKVRGVFAAGDQGWAELTLKDTEGRNRVNIFVNREGGAFVLLFDKQNPGRYHTGFRIPSINLIGPEGEIRASIP